MRLVHIQTPTKDMRSPVFMVVASIVASSMGMGHHGAPHTQERMMTDSHTGIKDRFEARMAEGWPNSEKMWADIPTSQTFNSHTFQKWASDSPEFFKEDGEANIHSKRQTPDLFKQPPSSYKGYGGGQQHDFGGHDFDEQPNRLKYNFKVNYKEVPRPKRQPQYQQDFVGGYNEGSPDRFNQPDFGQFRPTDFNQPEQSRPIRHTSYPATHSPQKPDDAFIRAKNQNTRPSFHAGFHPTKSHSYTSFEAPKLSSGFFIDHNNSPAQQEYNRPQRTPVSLPASPSSRLNFLPKQIKQTINHNFKGQSALPKQQDLGQLQEIEYDYDDEGANGINDEYQFADNYQPSSAAHQTFERSQFPQAPTVDDIDGNPDYAYGNQPYPYNRDRGQATDESYDRINKEENEEYEVKNYRIPIRDMAYERQEPEEVKSYGDSYGGVDTYSGGYDSEEDARRGIVRHHSKYQLPVARDIYVEDEPVQDYNNDGYYVPRERKAVNEEEDNMSQKKSVKNEGYSKSRYEEMPSYQKRSKRAFMAASSNPFVQYTPYF